MTALGASGVRSASLLRRLPELASTGLTERDIELLGRSTAANCTNGTSYGTYNPPTLPSPFDLEKRNAFVKRSRLSASFLSLV